MNKEIKKGDRLKVRDDLIVDETYGDFDFTQIMSKYKGEVVTIDKIYDINKGVYLIKEDGSLSAWTKSMLEFIVNETDDSYDAIIPEHYRQGQIDLIESWYRLFPFNEFKAGMIMYAQRYFMRKKVNRIEDMEKGLYVMQRLKEYEELEKEKENEWSSTNYINYM